MTANRRIWAINNILTILYIHTKKLNNKKSKPNWPPSSITSLSYLFDLNLIVVHKVFSFSLKEKKKKNNLILKTPKQTQRKKQRWAEKRKQRRHYIPYFDHDNNLLLFKNTREKEKRRKEKKNLPNTCNSLISNLTVKFMAKKIQ